MAGWNRTRPRAAMRLDGATGLARAEAAARYARAVRTSPAGSDACPPLVRMAVLVDAVNAELAHVSASPAVAVLHELPPFTTPRRAWFLRGAWCLLFDPHALGGRVVDEELGRVASAAYHEARHVEQTFRVARKLAAEAAARMHAASTERGVRALLRALGRRPPCNVREVVRHVP